VLPAVGEHVAVVCQTVTVLAPQSGTHIRRARHLAQFLAYGIYSLALNAFNTALGVAAVVSYQVGPSVHGNHGDVLLSGKCSGCARVLVRPARPCRKWREAGSSPSSRFTVTVMP
jgi:hypothetical protein